VASPAKASMLDILFGGRVGTSVDTTGGRRTVGGSPEAYERTHREAVARIARRRGRPPGGIFVVDGVGLAGLACELATAEAAGRSLVLRPVFRGGRAVDEAPLEALVERMAGAFRGWAMRARTSVEPFRHLLASRLSPGPGAAMSTACPFQRNCAGTSLDLEPDGGLHLCLDMADSGQYPLGNALDKSFDRDAWQALALREVEVDPKCLGCRWFAACQGGCMSEAIRDTGSPYGRPRLCALWTALFTEVDALVAREGREAVAAWLETVG
jgi:radical SAM protein with 4Fe4S-binding SPASM domain